MLRLELLEIGDRVEYRDYVLATIPALQEALRPGLFRDWWRRLLGDLASKLGSTTFISLRSADAEMRGTLRELFAPELDAALAGYARDRLRARHEQTLLKAIRASCSQLTTSPVQVYDHANVFRLVIERPGRSRGRAFEGEYAVRVVYWSTRDAAGYFRWTFRSLLGQVYGRHGVFNLLPPKRFGALAERSSTWALRWGKLAPTADMMGCDGLVALQLLHVRATLQAILKAGSYHATIPLLLTLFNFRLRDKDDPKGLLVYHAFINRLEAPDGVDQQPFYEFCQTLGNACHLTMADKVLAIHCYRHLTATQRSEFIAIARADDRKHEPLGKVLPSGNVPALLAASVIDTEAFLDDVDARLTANIQRATQEENGITPLIFNE